MPYPKPIRSWISLALLPFAMMACQTDAAKAPAAPAPPAPVIDHLPSPSGVAAAVDAGLERKSKLPPAPTDGLSLSERIEKRKAAEAKLAAELAGEERRRLLAYDKGKLALHNQVFSFITKTRAELDGAKNRAAVETLAAKQNKAIVATGKKLQLIDPKGGNSNVTTDYDVMLNALANDYPAALTASFDGDPRPLVEQKAELDKRTRKIEEWLRAIKAGK